MAGIVPADVQALMRSLISQYTQSRLRFAGHGDERSRTALQRIDRALESAKRAMVTGELPAANLRVPIRSSARFIAHQVGSVSRGEMVQLLSVGGSAPGAQNDGWWRVRTRGGIEGWAHRSDLLPGSPVELSSRPGAAGSRPPPDEIEIAGRG